jgi:predicted site-specific integrase-resolvase
MKPTAKITTDSRGRAAYRLREVFELTGIPTSTLRTMVRRGDLNPITSFGVWLIAAEELEALLQKRLRNGTVRRSNSNENES